MTDTCVPGPITSTEPIARVFFGSAPSTDYSGRPMPVIEETITIYFPDGTADGARAITTHPVSWPHDGLATSEATIAGGTVAVAVSGSYRLQDFSVSGTLDLASGIVTATTVRNFAPPYTDVASPGMGPITLCHVGPATGTSAITWSGTPSEVSALSTLHAAGTVPLDGAPLSLLHEGSAVPLEAMASMGVIDLRPVRAWPMGALTLAVAGADVMGNAPSLPAPVTVARPTTALADLTLDTAPPEGAVVGEWRDGALRAGLGTTSVFYSSRTLTAALGAPPPTATSVRVTFLRSYVGYAVLRAAVVTEDGAASELDLGETPSPEPRESVVPIPGSGALYLVAAIEAVPNRPQWLPAFGGGGIDVTGITFE